MTGADPFLAVLGLFRALERAEELPDPPWTICTRTR
jgi:hypothetical protein